MATNTPNLNLYKKDPVTDGEDVFNIETMLNENWDKIDTAVNNKAPKTVASASTNGLMSSTDFKKLQGIATGANNYVHPSTHAATMITEDASHRFVTDTEKAAWNAKETPTGAQQKVDAALATANAAINSQKADYVRQPAYAVTTGTATAYTVTLTPAPSALVEGFGITIVPHVANGANPTLNINGLGAVTLKDQKGVAYAAGKLAQGKPYTFRKVGSDFLADSAGGSGNATAGDIRAGKTAATDAGDVVGTLPVRTGGTVTPTATAITKAAGIYDDPIVIQGVSVPTDKVLTGTTIAGTAGTFAPKLTNLINNGSFENGLLNGWTYADVSSYGIASSSPKFGSKNLAVACDPEKTEGFAFQNVKYISGHTYYVSLYAFSGRQFTMDVFFPLINPYYPTSGKLYYSSANLNTWTQMSAVITTSSEIPSQTAPIRIDFNNNKTSLDAWMDGVVLIDLTETFGAGKEPDKATMDAIIQANGGWWDSSLELMTSDANATSAQMLSGYVAYSNGQKIEGTIPIRTRAAVGGWGGYTIALSALGDGGGALVMEPPTGYYESGLNDGNFGTLYASDPNFIAANIRGDKSIFGVQGSMPVQGAYTVPLSSAWDGYDVFVRIPQGVYMENGGSGYPEIRVPANLARADGNISAGNIRSGVWIYGVQGTLEPKLYASGTVWGNPGSIVVTGIGFRPTIFHCFIRNEYGEQSSNEIMYKNFDGSLFDYNRMNMGGYNQSIATHVTISDSGFTITSYYDQITSGTYTWHAWG